MKRLFLLLALALAAPAHAGNDKPLVIVSGQQRQLPAGDALQVNAAAAGNASINIPPGVDPTSPSNGDCWITSANFKCRVGGSTVAYSAGGSGTVTSVDASGGSTGLAFSGGPVTGSGTLTLGVSNAGTFRSAIGLGTAATANTGTSGANVPLLNAANAWSAQQQFIGATEFTKSGAATTNPSNWLLEPLVDVNDATQTALYIHPDSATSPVVYFGTSANHAILRFQYVDAMYGVPPFVTADAFTHGYSASASAQIGLQTGTTNVFLASSGPSASIVFAGSSTYGTNTTRMTLDTTTGNLTVTGTIGASNFSGSSSGTNTGDQTSVSGNAGTATKLATARTLAITGDLAWTSPSFDGSANVTAAGTLATVNSNVGTFGSATQVGTFTVNAKGLVTAASNTSIAIAESAVTNLTTDLAAKAPLASPALTGTPTAPTATAGTNTTQIATTAFVTGGYLPISNAVATGVFYWQQGAPTAVNASATLTGAQILGGIITTSSTTAVALALPTGTNMDSAFTTQNGAALASDRMMDWYTINTGSSAGAITMTAATGHTIVGNAVCPISATCHWGTRKTATNTVVTYRLG